MERKKATEFPQELLDLFHLYVHGEIGRAAFLRRAGKFAAGGVTAAGLLAMLKPNYAWAQQVPKDDKRIRVEYVTVASPRGNGSIFFTPTPSSANPSPMSYQGSVSGSVLTILVPGSNGVTGYTSVYAKS